MAAEDAEPIEAITLASPVTVKRNKRLYGKGAYGIRGILVLTGGRLAFLAPGANAWEIETANITAVRRPWYGMGSYLTLDVGGAYYALALGARGPNPRVDAGNLAIRHGGSIGMQAGLIGDAVAVAGMVKSAQLGRQWFDLLSPRR